MFWSYEWIWKWELPKKIHICFRKQVCENWRLQPASLIRSKSFPCLLKFFGVKKSVNFWVCVRQWCSAKQETNIQSVIRCKHRKAKHRDTTGQQWRLCPQYWVGPARVSPRCVKNHPRQMISLCQQNLGVDAATLTEDAFCHYSGTWCYWASQRACVSMLHVCT